MADKGQIDLLLNGLPPEQRYPLRSAFYHVLDLFKWGTGTRTENGQWYRFQSTTATASTTEFTIAHALGTIPTQLVQILDLSKVNSQQVPLQVSRAADASRIYLKSTSTNAVFTVLMEV